MIILTQIALITYVILNLINYIRCFKTCITIFKSGDVNRKQMIKQELKNAKRRDWKYTIPIGLFVVLNAFIAQTTNDLFDRIF